MAKKRGRLRLVSEHDPANIFDDLGALRKAQAAQTAPAELAFWGRRRQRIDETFARIPHDRARRLYRLSGSAWALLIELDRLVFEGRGKNPVRLTHRYLKAAQLSRFAAKRALRALEKAGVISVEHRRGRAPLVTHLWFPATV
jgi:hypothetical protein